MLHYLLLHYLRWHCFNVILFRISLQIFHDFNVSISGVAFFFEFTLFIALFSVPLFNVSLALLMLHYVNVALFTVPPFNVVLY